MTKFFNQSICVFNLIITLFIHRKLTVTKSSTKDNVGEGGQEMWISTLSQTIPVEVEDVSKRKGSAMGWDDKVENATWDVETALDTRRSCLDYDW